MLTAHNERHVTDDLSTENYTGVQDDRPVDKLEFVVDRRLEMKRYGSFFCSVQWDVFIIISVK